jgi:Zn-dependent protease
MVGGPSDPFVGTGRAEASSWPTLARAFAKLETMTARGIEGPLVSVPVVSRHGIFFWLFSTLVTVRFTFFLVMILMAGLSRRSVFEILIWVIVAGFGILLHEFGHVGAARYYRHKPRVELYTMGGVTTWESDRREGFREHLVISLAGPAIGLALAGLVWLLLETVGWRPGSPFVHLALSDFMWVSVGWGFFNLLPILPLDGGQALEAFLEGRRARDPRRTTRIVSLGVGAAVALIAFGAGWTWAGVLAAMFAYNNAQRMRGGREVRIVG